RPRVAAVFGLGLVVERSAGWTRSLREVGLARPQAEMASVALLRCRRQSVDLSQVELLARFDLVVGTGTEAGITHPLARIDEVDRALPCFDLRERKAPVLRGPGSAAHHHLHDLSSVDVTA